MSLSPVSTMLAMSPATKGAFTAHVVAMLHRLEYVAQYSRNVECVLIQRL